MNWRSLNGKYYEGIIEEILEEAIQREFNLGNELKICIGTDSLDRAGQVEFASVIVFLREKKGGFMFISNDKLAQKMSIKERMILEVAKSVEVAYTLCDLLDQYKIELEVHADINTDPSFKSNVALREAMGYILSMGFVFKAKPDAFASTSCADKCI